MGLKIINKYNCLEYKNKKYKYGELLLSFIYKDYSEVIEYLDKKLKIINSVEKYSALIEILDEIINNNSFKKISTFKDDPFCLLLLYELHKIKLFLDENILNLDKDNIAKQQIEEIDKIIFKFKNLQNIFYRAIDVCLNNSHLVLNKLSRDNRLNIYYNLPYEPNIFKNVFDNSLLGEIFIPENDIKNLNQELLSEKHFDEKYDLYEFKPDNYDSRLNETTYDVTNHSINYTKPKNYYFNMEDTFHKQEYIKVLDFGNVFSLCLFEFNKLVEDKNVTVRECKLCKKFFVTTVKSKKEYCDNIFKQYNKPCSDPSVGAKIFFEINNANNNSLKLYYRIYKRLDNRPSDNIHDKEALHILKKCYQSFYKNEISINEFNLILDEFNILKPNTFDMKLLTNKAKSIINKI